MKNRLGVLDGLRGIAIVQVLWYHLWLVGRLPAPVPWLQFFPETGAFGVDLFFFISGFVIVYPFVRAQFAGEDEPAWTHFAWRRFIKIVPSYALSIALAYAIGFAAIERTNSTVLQELVTHALFIHTWWPETFGSINGPLWTLALEVQFYALFPLLWWCFKRQAWVTGLGLIVFASALRAWAGHWWTPGMAAVISTNLPSYIDLFGFGMLSAWCFVHFGQRARDGRARYLMPLAAFAGAAMMTMTLVGFFQGQHGQNPWMQLPLIERRTFFGVACSLLAFGALCSARGWTLALSNPLLRFFAIISYNLYLFNWMIIHKLQQLHVPPYHGSDAFADRHWQVLFTLTAATVSIIFATLATYVVERPLLRIPDPVYTRAFFRADAA